MISAHADVVAGVVDGAALADDDVTGDAMLTTEDFNGFRIRDRCWNYLHLFCEP